jgi:hypothetical protein
MPYSLYDVTIPVFIRQLRILSDILEKGRKHAAGNEASLIEARLIADMAPLSFQVQRVSDTAKILAVKGGGAQDVVMEDNEKTFDELQERIKKTIAFLEPLKPDCMDANEDKVVRTVVRKGQEVALTGSQAVFEQAIPNFFFHLSMAYAILRKEGVDIGKKDYLGQL